MGMSPEIFPYIPYLGFAVIAGFFGLSWYLNKRRVEEVHLAAKAFGFSPGLDLAGFAADLRQLEFFNRGRSRGFQLMLQGTYQNCPTAIFEYYYVTKSGKNRTTHRYLCFAQRGERTIPRFDLRPEGWFDSVAAVFGSNDIDLPGNLEFSKRFHLSGDNPDSIRQLFSPTVTKRLLEEGKISLVASGNTLLVVERGKLRGAQFKELLEHYSALTRLFVR